MLKFEKHEKSNIEVEARHIIGRSKDIQKLKDMCKFNIKTMTEQQGKFKRNTLNITITNKSLDKIDDNNIKIGTSQFNIVEIYKVLEQTLNKKILLKDESRAIKKEQDAKYHFLILEPTNGPYPLIIVGNPYNYIIAPTWTEE